MLTEKQLKAIKEVFGEFGRQGVLKRDAGKTKEQISAEARARRIGWRKNKELDKKRIKNNN